MFHHNFNASVISFFLCSFLFSALEITTTTGKSNINITDNRFLLFHSNPIVLSFSFSASEIVTLPQGMFDIDITCNVFFILIIRCNVFAAIYFFIFPTFSFAATEMPSTKGKLL